MLWQTVSCSGNAESQRSERLTTEQFVSQPVGMVRTKISEGSAGLTNISKANWTYTMEGKTYTCPPQQTVKLHNGMTIRIGSRDITVHM